MVCSGGCWYEEQFQAPLSKCGEARGLKCWQLFQALFRILPPYGPPFWVLFAKYERTVKVLLKFCIVKSSRKKKQIGERETKSSEVIILGGETGVASSFILKRWGGFLTMQKRCASQFSGS